MISFPVTICTVTASKSHIIRWWKIFVSGVTEKSSR